MSSRTPVPTRRARARLVAAGAALAAGVAAMSLPMTASAATTTCTVNPGLTSAYSVKVCLTSPATGSTLTGDATVTATVTITGTSPGLAKTEFRLNGSYLLTDFQTPYTFTLRTTDFVDGAYTVGVSAILRDGYVPPATTMPVTMSNGITTPPVGTNSWTAPSAAARPWQTPTILAATGDGAGGESNATNVVNLIDGWNPDLFAYTGDVYEKGTITEFRNWYGTDGAWFSKFRDRTLPVVGNHEYENNQAPGYFQYWDQIPHYYSVDVNGWHIIGIDTTSQYNQAGPGSAQYEWLKADLEANTSPCTIVTGHHPLYNIGKEVPATRLQGMWQLMADHGVTMFLVGHDHTYQRWTPLDGAGNPATDGVTELVVGTGGHSSQAAATSDFRVLSYSKAYGAVKMALYGDRVTGQFKTTTGTQADTFDIPCKGADGIAPSAPTGLTATSADGPGGPDDPQVTLSWTAAADNFGVTGYRITRDGAVVAETASTTWIDTAVDGSTDYDYVVLALDAAGNTKGASAHVRTGGTDVTVPTRPTGLAATTSSPTSIELTWEAATDNIAVTGYEVTRDGDVVGTPSGTSFTDAVAGPGDHTYTVAATDAAGNVSDPSAPITASSQNLTPPEPPTGLAGEVQGSQVVLTWTAPGSGTPAAGYDILRDGTKVDETTGRSYTDTPPASFATHTYTVRSFSDSGVRSGPSDPIEVTIGDTEAPSVPNGVSATASGPNSASVVWDASTDNAGVAEYRISRNGTQVATVPGGTTSWSDTGLLSQTTYTYRVSAWDGAGNGSGPSDPSSATTPAPTAQVATADAYTNADSPGTNYGSSTALRLDGTPARRPYVRLPVGSGQGSIARVRLRVYLQSKLTAGFTVNGVDWTGTEKSLTWNNAPAPGAAVASSGSVGAAGWVELDITPLAQGVSSGGSLGVALLSSTPTSAGVSSRETANKPQLLVDWSG